MIRKGSHGDVTFMRSMLAHAYGWRVNQFEAEIPLTRYVDNWGREGDIALVATENGHPVGAAWLRVFRADAPGYGFVDEQTPEVTISIVPSRRGHGLGRSCSMRCSRPHATPATRLSRCRSRPTRRRSGSTSGTASRASASPKAGSS